MSVMAGTWHVWAMTMIFSRGALGVAGLGAFGLVLAGCAPRETAAPDPVAKEARGKYLVERVGMCIDCHSPRGPGGQFDLSRWLQGAPLGFAPTVPMPAWAPYAPAIAGLTQFTDEQALALLTEGKTVSGQPLRPPMPEYRFNREDAEAIVAYLRSLKPAGP